MSVKIVEFPVANVTEVPDALRALADEIEAGTYGETVFNIAWVMDCGDSVIEVGLLGKAAAPGAEAFLLLEHGQQVIMQK